MGSGRGEAKSKNCEGKVTIEKVTATFLSSLTLETTVRPIYNKVKGPTARALVAGAVPKRRCPLSRFLKSHGLSLVCTTILFLALVSQAYPGGPEDFVGEYVNRDFPGSHLSVGTNSVRLAEGEGARSVEVEGRIVSRAPHFFMVTWRVTDPNAIRVSRFEAQFSASIPVALKERPEGGPSSSVKPVYLPAGRYRLPSFVFVSPSGQKMVLVYDLKADWALLWLDDGRLFRLPRALSASGARYSDGNHTFWEHQGSAVVEIDGQVVFEGVLQDG